MKKRWLFSFAGTTLLLLAFLSFSFTKAVGKNYPEADTAVLPAFAFAKDHKGVNVIAESGLITLTSGLDNDYYQVDSLNRTGFLYIETKMERFVNESTKRIPLNLAIVIDRSGSMQGGKMEAARKAAKDIIDRLTADDYVSVVIYDEIIDVIQTSTKALNKDSIKAKIDKVKPRGSTNLWGGSEMGYAQVKAAYKKNFINRVLLISDGQANAGTTNPVRIRNGVQERKDIDGISISTFGVGLDYNETLMTDMAEAGAGNYYYIEKGEQMAAMFEKELNGLLNVVAQDAELRISLPKEIEIEKVYPFKYNLQGNDIVIRYRDLFSEESKGLMLRFRIANGTKTDLAFTTKLTYTAAADGSLKTVSNINKLLPIKNVEAYLTQFNKTVAEQVVLFTANEQMEAAMLAADKGNYQLAEGLAASNQRYFKSNARYVNASKELQKMDSLNYGYSAKIQRVKLMGADSVKIMQKSSRADSYKLRNKKG